jgi:AcrR family transcriptional regulator
MKNHQKSSTKPGFDKQPIQKRAFVTRQKIIDAAKSLIADIGYEATTTTAIVKRAGISHGSIYNYFNNRWEIFYSIQEELYENLYSYTKESIDKTLEQQSTVDEAIALFIPGLFRAHKLEGKLNYELNKFALIDDYARDVQKQWRDRFKTELIRFLEHFSSETKLTDFESAVYVIFVTVDETFHSLYDERDTVDEYSILTELIRMIKDYVIKREHTPPV